MFICTSIFRIFFVYLRICDLHSPHFFVYLWPSFSAFSFVYLFFCDLHFRIFFVYLLPSFSAFFCLFVTFSFRIFFVYLFICDLHFPHFICLFVYLWPSFSAFFWNNLLQLEPQDYNGILLVGPNQPHPISTVENFSEWNHFKTEISERILFLKKYKRITDRCKKMGPTASQPPLARGHCTGRVVVWSKYIGAGTEYVQIMKFKYNSNVTGQKRNRKKSKSMFTDQTSITQSIEFHILAFVLRAPDSQIIIRTQGDGRSKPEKIQ